MIQFKLSVYAVKTHGQGVQMSVLRLMDSDQRILNWPSGTFITTSGFIQHPPSEQPANLLNDNPYSKCYGTYNTYPIDYIITIPTSIDVFGYPSYFSYFSANDVPARDPKTFTLYFSNEDENFVPILEVKDYIHTNARYTESTRWQVQLFQRKFLILDEGKLKYFNGTMFETIE